MPKDFVQLREKGESYQQGTKTSKRSVVTSIFGRAYRLRKIYERSVHSTGTPPHKDCKWRWTDKEEDAFRKSKDQLVSTQVLTHDDLERPLVLWYDASAYAIGEVLAHSMEDGTERPIAFASRSLNQADKVTARLKNKDRPVAFWRHKFQSYVCGCQFPLITDHKPLITLYSEERSVPTQVSARTQRRALKLDLMTTDRIRFKQGAAHFNADAQSRLPLPDKPKQVPVPGDTILTMEVLDRSPKTAVDIKQWTRRDPIPAQVLKFTLERWPQSIG